MAGKGSVLLKLCFLLVVLVVNFAAITHESSGVLKEIEFHDKRSQRSAIVYLGRMFHEEVSVSVTCMLRQLGYRVQVYVKRTFIQSLDSTAVNSICAHKIVEASTVRKFNTHPDVVVFVTYPVLSSADVDDESAIHLLSILDSSKLKQLLLIGHHADQHLPHQYDTVISKYIPTNKVTVLLLAEHVHKHAQTWNYTTIRTDHIFPILPSGLLKSAHEGSTFPEMRSHVAIQGNFGGRHAKRRDLVSTHQCLQALHGEMHNSPLMQSMFTCKESSSMTDLVLIGSVKGPVDWKSLLLGQLEGDGVERAASISMTPKVTVQFTNSVKPAQFYATVQQATFMMTALSHDVAHVESSEHLTGTRLQSFNYMHSAASSSVPVALLTEVPLVTISAFLQRYPCLRDAPILRKINGGSTECENLRSAMHLSKAEYEAARLEMRNCSQMLWDQSVATLAKLVNNST